MNYATVQKVIQSFRKQSLLLTDTAFIWWKKNSKNVDYYNLK